MSAAVATWGDVHVGDTVRGADQRVWTVAGRGRVTHWTNVRSGEPWDEVRFRLRLGEREVTAARRLSDPAPLVERADHTDIANAWAVMTAAGLNPELLEEDIDMPDPFEAPLVKVKHDRWGRYLLPDPQTGKERAWTRVTTVAKAVADEYGLTLWKMRMVAKGVALRPDLIEGAAAADPEEDKATLNEIAEKALERAGGSSGATRGTARHTVMQRLDRGDTSVLQDIPESMRADVEAGRSALKAHKLRVIPETIERVLVLPELGIAGRVDSLVEQPPGQTKSGKRAVIDWKSGKDLGYAWLEIAIQESLYAHATLMWNERTQSYEPMPEVDKDRGLVVHLPAGKAQGVLYAVNLIEGWEYAQLALKVREARSRSRGLSWLVEPEPADLALHRVSRAANQQELAQLWDRLHPQGLWTEEVNAAAAKRWQEINTTATVTA